MQVKDKQQNKFERRLTDQIQKRNHLYKITELAKQQRLHMSKNPQYLGLWEQQLQVLKWNNKPLFNVQDAQKFKSIFVVIKKGPIIKILLWKIDDIHSISLFTRIFLQLRL
ncbi:unnamed protein product [Paramecium octaurelia]|uniref:Uncharacterized protein n=1 Tax=Paramecium octaurelia TaxID=43137 RepID=A0A8S1T0M0_PAROT|nr:unnamed protein product [Paramecium octaurelia]